MLKLCMTEYLSLVPNNKEISLYKIHGLGFDGTNAMSGEKSGVQKRMKCIVLMPSITIVFVINCN